MNGDTGLLRNVWKYRNENTWISLSFFLSLCCRWFCGRTACCGGSEVRTAACHIIALYATYNLPNRFKGIYVEAASHKMPAGSPRERKTRGLACIFLFPTESGPHHVVATPYTAFAPMRYADEEQCCFKVKEYEEMRDEERRAWFL
jgi:hypothetical protein